MRAGRDRCLWSQIIRFQSPPFHTEKTYNYTHITYTHVHILIWHMHICMHVNVIWMDMNLMLYMSLHLISMVNTVTETWFTKYNSTRQLLSFQNRLWFLRAIEVYVRLGRVWWIIKALNQRAEGSPCLSPCTIPVLPRPGSPPWTSPISSPGQVSASYFQPSLSFEQRTKWP